jgi:hypothetical protein
VDLWGAFGGGRITPEDARALIILRRYYGISRLEAARLPLWEFELLVAAAIEPPVDAASGGSPSELDIITTPGLGG